MLLPYYESVLVLKGSGLYDCEGIRLASGGYNMGCCRDELLVSRSCAGALKCAIGRKISYDLRGSTGCQSLSCRSRRIKKSYRAIFGVGID